MILYTLMVSFFVLERLLCNGTQTGIVSTVPTLLWLYNTNTQYQCLLVEQFLYFFIYLIYYLSMCVYVTQLRKSRLHK